MRWIKRLLWLVVSLFAAVMALQFAASESGEVVVLSTLDAKGAPQETRLWVVDLEGSQYLRAGQPESGWLLRLQKTPRVGLVRGEVRAAYDAVPEPEKRDVINARMRAKYGWADQVIEQMFGRDKATPVRLEPVPEGELPPELRDPVEEAPLTDGTAADPASEPVSDPVSDPVSVEQDEQLGT
ncbi:MAG: hypothetical protein R3E84_01355 [Pseudomonadales bacterium]